MHATHNQDTHVDQPASTDDVFGVCDYCGTPNVARVLVTEADNSGPRMVCADPAACAGAAPTELFTAGTGDRFTVTDIRTPDQAVPGEAPGTAAQVLRDAALYLERHGWIQGAYYDGTSQSFTPAACMVGAIGMACYGGPVDAPAQHFDDPGFLDFEEAVLHLDRYLLAEDGSESYEFNDAKGRRAEDVTRVLRDAAARPADELIDALRAIDQRNADTTALSVTLTPGGTFAEGATDGGAVRPGCSCAETVSGSRWPCTDCPGWQSQPATSGGGDVR